MRMLHSNQVTVEVHGRLASTSLLQAISCMKMLQLLACMEPILNIVLTDLKYWRRHELDITALTGCLEREEKARTEEAAEHATAAAALQKNIADLQVLTFPQRALNERHFYTVAFYP